MQHDQLTDGRGNFITLAEAIILTTKYRNNKDSILASGVDKKVLPICESFPKSAVIALFDQAEEECVGLRCYLGMDANNYVRLVFVGYNSAGDDILTVAPVIIENGDRCPDLCPPRSPLNG